MENKKWVLITGAEGGIGSALVQEFTNENYHVIAADITHGKSEWVNDKLYKLHLDLRKLVEEEDSTTRLLAQVNEITKGAGLFALINNAAVQILAPTKELTQAQWHATWAVNLHAPFLLIQTFLDSLASNNGAVVNICSIHAKQTLKRFVAYATSKAALSSLTKNLAVDLGGLVRINAIEPAAVGTEMLVAGFSGMEDKLAELNQYHPLGRIAEPKEVAELAVYLCSEKSRFVQGACISASGGIDGCLFDPHT